MDTQIAKQAASAAAALFVEDGMKIGIGTGSTAAFLIDALIERCKKGLKVEAVATSSRSHEMAVRGGIPLIDINTVYSLDLTIDGADEVDSMKRMIKGGGGALLREKIVANMSKEMVVIVDETKMKDFLGAFPLPVEIVPFAAEVTLKQLKKKGYKGSFRKAANGDLYVTDNGNYIADIELSYPCLNPEEQDLVIRSIPGVVETGFFLGMAGRVIVGSATGSVKIL